MKKKLYISLALVLTLLQAYGQTSGDETIKRSVTLYNPYKPSLQDASKRVILPPFDDTLSMKVDFNYSFKPGSFTPAYKVSPIKSVTLSPDPLPKLKNGYVNLGLGSYLTPFLEISASNGRSKKGTIGIYTRSYASAGRTKLENNDQVFAGFMDNHAILYGKKYYRNSRFDADIDFRQMSRYAYGYNTEITGYDPDRKDIRSLYFDITGKLRYFTMEKDSNDLNYDVSLRYNFFSSGNSYTQHNPGLCLKGGKNVFGLYGGLTFDYDLYLFSDSIDQLSRNLFSLKPYITKGNDEWRFRFGFKAVGDIRENMEALSGDSKKLYVYFYPDVSFTFRIIPDFLRFRIAVDGDMENNQAKNIVYLNPFIMPGDTMYYLRNTDNKLRVTAGLGGNINVSASYALDISYTFFEDKLMFRNDTVGAGNHFLPVYDEGDMLRLHGEFKSPLTEQLSLSLKGNYYRYSLSDNDYAWHLPDWDITLEGDYNLRDKIIATASLAAVGKRHAMVTAPDYDVILPMHLNLNLGVEYRYTRLLSFWVKMNNISYNRYYEWNYYPSQNFLILGGFTYSL